MVKNAFQLAETVIGQTIDMDGLFGGQCLTGEYLVKMINNTYKYMKDLEIGDIVSTGNVVYENEAFTAKSFLLRTEQGCFKVTEGHKVFTDNGQKKVEELTKKDSIILNSDVSKRVHKELTANELKFFGVWLAKGRIVYRKKTSTKPVVTVSVASKEKQEYIRGLYLNTTTHTHSGGKYLTFTLTNRLHESLYKLVERFKDKNLLDEFTPTQYKYILEGYFSMKGNKSGNSLIVRETNKHLLVTLQHGCHVNGWWANLGKKVERKRTNLTDNPKPFWMLRLKKEKALSNRFVSLTPDKEETFYRLNVNGDHSYLADNQKHHNCADLAHWVGVQYGVPLYGDGNQIGLINGPNFNSVADVIPYTQGTPLQVGDILSINIGEFGHVVVYGGGPLNNALVIDQNYASVQKVQKRTWAIPNILRIVRFRNQEQYGSGGHSGDNVTTSVKQQVPEAFKRVHEILCAEVKGIRGNGDSTVLDTFYKCNKVIGEFAGDWFIYRRFTGDVGYIPANCVSKTGESTKPPLWSPPKLLNNHQKFPDTTYDGLSQHGTQVIYSLDEFIRKGRVEYLGYEWMYESKENFRNLKKISTRINQQGFLVDNTNKIILVLPEAYQAVDGTILKTPFGLEGVVRGSHNKGQEVIVYIR